MAKCLVARYVLNARQSEIFKENSLKGCFQLILDYQKCHTILKNYFCAFSWQIFWICAIAQLSTLRNSTLLIRLSSNALKWKISSSQKFSRNYHWHVLPNFSRALDVCLEMQKRHTIPKNIFLAVVIFRY